MEDLVGSWEVSLPTGKHFIEFEHGTTTGKRIVRVDGKEVFRKDWMFKLVGSETFSINGNTCVVSITPFGSWSYQYLLSVNGTAYKTFSEARSRIQKTWVVTIRNTTHRVVLEKDTLDIWLDGHKIDATGEFVDDGTETHFEIDGIPSYIKAVTSGKRREGIIHALVVGDEQIPEATE